MYAAKVDDNHNDIKRAFERLGFDVIDTHNSRGTLLDLIVTLQKKTVFVEIKSKKKYSLTEAEKKFIFIDHPTLWTAIICNETQVIALRNKIMSL
jgi:Holliday junction resolvase